MSPVPAPASWPTQTEAAMLLGTGERTIRRWIDAGRLKSALRPAPGRKPVVVVDPEDVEKLRVERQPPALIQDYASAASNDTGVPAIREQMPDAIARLAEALAAFRPEPAAPALKPWLTLEEAALFSGLPKSFLLTQAKTGKYKPAVDVGRRKGGRWRFRRDLL
jgi:excisionase family DNA binding protein